MGSRRAQESLRFQEVNVFYSSAAAARMNHEFERDLKMNQKLQNLLKTLKVCV